jgi:hypothetical protein
MKRLAFLVAVLALAGCTSGQATVTVTQTAAPAVSSVPSPSTSALSPQQAQSAQAQQDKDRVLASAGWQPVPGVDTDTIGPDDWLGVKCSSQAPDTPPNAAVGGNLTLTVWNPGPDDQTIVFDQVDFPGGAYSPINSQDINIDTTVAAGVVDVFHTSYISLVGNWAAGCYISTAGLEENS